MPRRHRPQKQDAAVTWKKTFGFRPLLAFLEGPEVAGGERLAGLLRPGYAGSNTAADHVTVQDLALLAPPEHARPRPGDLDSPRVLARSDSAGATHVFAAACRTRGVRFSFGFPIDERIQHIVGLIPGQPPIQLGCLESREGEGGSGSFPPRLRRAPRLGRPAHGVHPGRPPMAGRPG